MAKRVIACRVELNWRRMLGFDQAASAPDLASAAQLSPKIGPKDARGFSTYGSLGAKIGPKEARGFDRCAAALGAKVGFKEAIRPEETPAVTR